MNKQEQEFSHNALTDFFLEGAEGVCYQQQSDAPKKSQGVSYGNFNEYLYPFGLHHLVWERQRGRISFEDLRSVIVSWAKKELQEEGEDENTQGSESPT